MKGSLKQIWKSINILQFWVFIPFWINLKSPFNADAFLQALHNFAVGELVDKKVIIELLKEHGYDIDAIK